MCWRGLLRQSDLTMHLDGYRVTHQQSATVPFRNRRPPERTALSTAPVLSWLLNMQRTRPESRNLGPSIRPQQAPGLTVRRQSSQSLPLTVLHGLSLKHPALRASPFPEVTDLICRLPLPTLFYRPEAVNLGDLMRL